MNKQVFNDDSIDKDDLYNDKVFQLFSASLDEDLTDQEKMELSGYLDEDPGLLKEMEDLEAMTYALRNLPDIPLPDNFQATLHEKLLALSNEEKKKQIQERKFSFANLGNFLKPMLAVAVLCLVVMVSDSQLLAGWVHDVRQIDNSLGPQVAQYQNIEPESDHNPDSSDIMGKIDKSNAPPAPIMADGESNSWEYNNGMASRQEESFRDMPQTQASPNNPIPAEDFPRMDIESGKGDLAGMKKQSIAENAVGNPKQIPNGNIERKIIKNVDITLEIDDYQQVFDKISSLAEQYGGYVASGYTNSGSNGKPSDGSLCILVEQKSMDNAVDEITKMGIVRNQNFSGDDITEQYYDYQGRLVQYQKEEAKLLTILEKAQTVEDILAVERELSRVRSELEAIKGDVENFDQLTELSNINVFLAVPNYYDNTLDSTNWHDMGQRIVNGFYQGLQ
ncbi:MAG: DUF4349 domain-containing protein, partial [Clostridiales bacterium]